MCVCLCHRIENSNSIFSSDKRKTTKSEKYTHTEIQKNGNRKLTKKGKATSFDFVYNFEEKNNADERVIQLKLLGVV